MIRSFGNMRHLEEMRQGGQWDVFVLFGSEAAQSVKALCLLLHGIFYFRPWRIRVGTRKSRTGVLKTLKGGQEMRQTYVLTWSTAEDDVLQQH